MIKRTSILFILILSLVFNFKGISQIKKAEKNFQFYNYSKAIPFLLKAVESGDEDIRNKAIPMLAHCYRLTNNTGEARDWYEKAVEINGTDSINFFYLGQAYRGLGLYDEAANAFQTYQAGHPDTLDVKKYYNYCVNIQEWLKLPPTADVKNVELINTRYSDFGPTVYKNGIVFTSDRKKDQLDDTYGWTNFNYLNLHYTEPEYYRNFWSPMKPATLMENNFNQSYHDGPATFTSDFSRVYVTKTVEKDGKKDRDNIHTSLLKIFYSDIVEGKKMSFREMPFNSKNYSVAHPTLSQDNQQIIFSSDMPGGFGGSDLYLATFEDGEWSSPQNLGKNLNSEGNEVFPFWANDSVLFFSSDDHMGYGGLDIFRSLRINDSTWTEPENLKAPINTSYDDFGIVLSENLTEGLLSSNRPEGAGSDDIYAFQNLQFVQPIFMVCGFVKEQNTLKPLGNATVFFLDANKGDVTIAKTDPSGYFEIAAQYGQLYAAKAMKDSFIYDCLSFRTPEINESSKYNMPHDLLLKKLVLEHVTKVEIYYDLDKYEIREDAKPVLDSLVQFLHEHPIRAELSSHTDCRATVEYNLKLSQKRAEAAVEYMVSQGIEAERITAKGYGESELVNYCADGVSCSEEEHQANRRTEFKITGIDMELLEGHQFELDLFEVGDVVSPTLFDANFFSNCLATEGK